MENHPNFVIARRLWDAIASADVPALRTLLSDKAVWWMPGNSPLAGAYEGVDAILQFMARVGELSDDLQSDLLEIFVNDRGAVLRYDIHAFRGSQVLDTEHLFRIRIEEHRITQAVFAPLDQRRYDSFFTPH